MLTPDAYLIFLISAAWKVNQLGFQSTRDEEFLKHADELEKFWRIETSIFFLTLSLWARSR